MSDRPTLPHYEGLIELRHVTIPFVPEIITAPIETALREGRYEAAEHEMLSAALRPGDRVLDLGGGVGLTSTVAARAPGVESVTCVEAHPGMIAMIAEVHRLNGVDVDLRSGVAAPAGATGDAPFRVAEHFWASSTLGARGNPHVRVPRIDTAALIAETRPTVITCDIEGGERGLFETVDLSGVREVIVELHPGRYGVDGADDVTRAIEAQGLLWQRTGRPSSVRRFVREAAPEPDGFDLSWLRGRPWRADAPSIATLAFTERATPDLLDWLAWHRAIGVTDPVVLAPPEDALCTRLAALGHIVHQPARTEAHAIAAAPTSKAFRSADLAIWLPLDAYLRPDGDHLQPILRRTGPFDAMSITAAAADPARSPVRTLFRVSERLAAIRPHRPQLARDAGAIRWLDGSGSETLHFWKGAARIRHDAAGTTDLIHIADAPAPRSAAMRRAFAALIADAEVARLASVPVGAAPETTT